VGTAFKKTAFNSSVTLYIINLSQANPARCPHFSPTSGSRRLPVRWTLRGSRSRLRPRASARPCFPWATCRSPKKRGPRPKARMMMKWSRFFPDFEDDRLTPFSTLSCHARIPDLTVYTWTLKTEIPAHLILRAEVDFSHIYVPKYEIAMSWMWNFIPNKNGTFAPAFFFYIHM
jgi:hypothetical protein